MKEKYPEPIDLANARAECLRDQGWEITVEADGTMRSEIPSGQESAYDADDLACLQELGIDPSAPTPEETLERIYPIYLEGAGCLRSAGWDVSEAPTLAVFKETYETAPWFPWGEVPPEEWAEAEKSCPQPEATY